MTAHASGARTFGDSVFDRARAKVSVEGYLGGENVKVAKAGKDLRGACVLCDGGTTKFCILGKHGQAKWVCYGCERHGDVVDLVAAHRRMAPYDAARWLLGEDVPHSAPARVAKPAAPSGPSTSDKVAAEIWKAAQPFAGSLAERYLIGRGIAPGVVMLAAPQLRYHASAKHHWDDDAGQWVRAPAMVAQVVTEGPDGAAVPTGGVHVTYLDRTTAGKATFRLRNGQFGGSKLMWGPQHGADGRPGGAWLISETPAAGSRLVNAEGIETALSLATLAWRRGTAMRVCVALSLGRLQGGLLRDDDGCIDPWAPQPDPASPAFVWTPPADDPWPEVLIAVDRDMAEVKARMRTGRGKPVDARLTAEVRARICGRLATLAWKAAGAARVRAIAPPPGSDFNDDLRRVLAAADDKGLGECVRDR
ncbi:MAG: hypothetical protein JF588_19325 [Caulobacterales bacterium]|nr:hypothetical protein [Caulobacterales bacterium]